MRYLKGVDVIAERPSLKAYWERLEKLPCWNRSRGPNSLGKSASDVRWLEADYSDQCAHWCIKKWNLKFANLRCPKPDVITKDEVNSLPYDTIVLMIGGCYVKGLKSRGVLFFFPFSFLFFPFLFFFFLSVFIFLFFYFFVFFGGGCSGGGIGNGCGLRRLATCACLNGCLNACLKECSSFRCTFLNPGNLSMNTRDALDD